MAREELWIFESGARRKFLLEQGFLRSSRIGGGVMSLMEWDALLESAWNVRKQAYAPYSRFAVGAALLAVDGRVFSGCNVENVSFGLTMCAERVALGTALAAGVREFLGIAIVADTSVPVSPCGACRQVLAEFGVPCILLANRTARLEFTLEELLPRAVEGILDHEG